MECCIWLFFFFFNIDVGTELSSSCLHSKHFTNGALFSAIIIYLKNNHVYLCTSMYMYAAGVHGDWRTTSGTVIHRMTLFPGIESRH